MFNLETALSTWRHQYKYSRAFKGRDLDELEQHLRDQVAFLVEQGETEEEAFRAAVAELGSQHETESEFRSVAWMKTRDRREVGKEIRYQGAMLANYARVAARNLRKNRVPSLINLIGLSVAIAVTMVAYTFVNAVLTKDYYHENADDIFLVHQVSMEEGSEQWWGHTPTPLGKALMDESTLFQEIVRIQIIPIVVHVGENDRTEWVNFADDGFFEMFDYEVEHGSLESFGEGNGIVLDSRAAEYYFGDENPVGQSLDVTIDEGAQHSLPIIAVLEQFRADAGMRFEMMIPMHLHPSVNESDWTQYAHATFLLRNSGVSEADMRVELNNYLDQANAPTTFEVEDWQLTRFEVDNLKNLVHNRPNVERSIISWISWAPVIVLSLISALLLLLACFNYMNISMAMATKRLREIGVRKAVGGSRKQVIFQFLTENIELSLLSLVMGLWIAWQFLLPAFSDIAGIHIGLGLAENYRIWLFMLAIVVGTGLVAGAYPALYISRFSPTAIFQKRAQLKSKRPLTHGFLAIQFVLAFLTMSAGIVLSMNGQYLANKDWGYDAAQKILYFSDDPTELQMIHSTLDAQVGVMSTITSREVVGFSFTREVVEGEFAPEEGLRSSIFAGDPGYMDFMGIELVSGVALSDSSAGFGPESIIVNETFVRRADLADPLGSIVVVDSTARTIVGVAADFHHESFFAVIAPTIFQIVPPEEHVFVTAMIAPGATSDVVAAVETMYNQNFPGRDITVRYHDQVFEEFQQESGGLTAIFTFVAILALLISCLSIYALSAQNVLNRMKEIGVRKVLGGDALGITHLVNRKYVIIMSIGAAISLPVAWVGLDALINDIYAYAMDMTILPFLVTYAIILIVALLTITSQTRTIRRAQPADILRVE